MSISHIVYRKKKNLLNKNGFDPVGKRRMEEKRAEVEISASVVDYRNF